MKKLLKLIITTCMLVTCFTVNVFAEEITSTSKVYGDKSIQEIWEAWGKGEWGTVEVQLSLKNESPTTKEVGIYAKGKTDNASDIFTATAANTDTILFLDNLHVIIGEGANTDNIRLMNGSYYVDGNAKIIGNRTEPIGSADRYWDDFPNDIEISGDYSFGSKGYNFDKVVVKSGKLSVVDYFEVNELVINSGASVSIENNGFFAINCKFNNNGTIEGKDDHTLEIREDVEEVSGFTYLDGDNTVTSYPISEKECRTFSYIEGNWVLCLPGYDNFPWDDLTEALIEICVLGNIEQASSELSYEGSGNIPTIEKDNGLSRKFVIPQGTTSISLKVNYDDMNYHVSNAFCEKDENLKFENSEFVFDINNLITAGDTFVHFEVEINKNISKDIKYSVGYDNKCGAVFVKDDSVLVGIDEDHSSFIKSDDEKISQTFYVLENEGYRLGDVIAEVGNDDYRVEYLGDETIGDVNYRVVNVEALNDSIDNYSLAFNFVKLMTVTFNSNYGSIKLVMHNYELDQDYLEDIDADSPVIMDMSDRVEFAVIANENYFVRSVKLDDTTLNKYERNIGGTTYECYSFNTENEVYEYGIDIIYMTVKDALKEDLANYKLAFYGNKDAIKGYAAEYIYDEFCKNWHGDAMKYLDLFASLCDKSVEDLKASDIANIMTLSDNTSTTDSITYDGNLLPYYTYSISGVGQCGKIYLLSTKNEFILRDGSTYKKIVTENDCTMLNSVYYAEIENLDDYEVFGNGALDQGQSRLYDDQPKGYADVRQIGALGGSQAAYDVECSLVLFKSDFLGTYVKANKFAAPWTFANYPLYPLNGGNTVCSVFLENGSVLISTQTGSPNNSKIIEVSFPNGTSFNDSNIKITDNLDGTFTVDLGSIFYDEITVNVKFNDGSIKPLVIKRVGIKVLTQEPWTGDYDNVHYENKYQVWHGTDEPRFYSPTNDNNFMISGSYYYGSASDDRVSLFATIYNQDGSIERKLINSRLTSNIESIHVDDPDPNNDSYFDDFCIWEGKKEDAPTKVEVIAFCEGASTDTFGGVNLGAGKGVVWTKQ